MGFDDPHRAPGPSFANEGDPPGTPARLDPASLRVPGHLPDRPEVRSELAEYARAVGRLDAGVGRVLKALSDAGRDGDTLVMFLSDNGIPFPGAKTTLYDAGVRLPLIVRAPGVSRAGTTCDALVSFLDVAPTMLAWANVPAPKAMSGTSLLPRLDGSPDPARTHVFGSHQFHEVTMYYPMRSVRTARHKLIVNLAHPLEFPSASDLWASPTWQGVLKSANPMMGRRTVAAFRNRPREELYDIVADPDEARNLAGDPAHAATLHTLRERLLAWRTATADPRLVKERYE